jgi:hypothetical protein
MQEYVDNKLVYSQPVTSFDTRTLPISVGLATRTPPKFHRESNSSWQVNRELTAQLCALACSNPLVALRFLQRDHTLDLLRSAPAGSR